MQYLCLVYRTDDGKNERDCQAETHALVEALSERGYDVAAYSLAPPHEACSLRRTGDGLVLSEGPVTEGSARLHSLFVIGARDLNEAVRLAASLPEAADAEIEIRPVKTPLPAADPQPVTEPDPDAQVSSQQAMTIPG